MSRLVTTTFAAAIFTAIFFAEVPWISTASGQAVESLGWMSEVRTLTGAGNQTADLGAVGMPLLRISYSDYPDGIGEEIRKGENPRRISNLVVNQRGESIPSRNNLSDAVWAWGQFIDHDLDLSDSHPDNGSANIPVLDTSDILFPLIFFDRANHLVIDGIREQMNEVTSFLDGSQVYGSDDFRAMALRSHKGGQMNMSRHRLLPLNKDGLPNLGEDRGLFLAGDIRCNENVVLTSLHTLFVREHNRLARRIRRIAPNATDEQVYQMARKIVGAEIQIITYMEFLPALLGHHAPSPFSCQFDPGVDPTIANEFSGALFRVGHTLLSSDLRVGNTGETIRLQDAFTNPDFIKKRPSNIGQMLVGLSKQRCQEIDATIIDDVRNFLFLPPPFAVGLDLAALNIQRGREHGLPVYNDIREAYGLPRISSFHEITSSVRVQKGLIESYNGDVDAIDPWVGGICEDHVEGANVGPLLLAAIHDQFSRTRDGDRFFYTIDPDLELPMIRKVVNLERITLGRVIRWNTRMKAAEDMFSAE